jgi:hypothetical protein
VTTKLGGCGFMRDNQLEPRLTHGALRTRIKKVRACAHHHDHGRLRWEVERLSSSMEEHLAVESFILEQLPEHAARKLRAGQKSIVSTLQSLRADLDVADPGGDREALAVELDRLFELQDDAERRGFGDRHHSW